MSLPVPDWISFEADQTQGLDLLGLRAPVEAIGNDLLNGVTTVTLKLRYLSAVVWIIWRYAQARLPDASGPFSTFVGAQEALIVLANRLRDRGIRNLVGVTEADELLDSGVQKLALRQFTQNTAFNIYISSSRQLNLTHRTESGFNGLTQDRGLDLAKAFDDTIRPTAYGAELSRRPTLDSVARHKLVELSDVIDLDRIPPRERAILIDAIMPSAPIDDDERRRLANYCLFLWLNENKKREIEERDIFDAAMETPRALPNCLRATLDGWLRYIIRDLLAVTHEAVFESVLRKIDMIAGSTGAPAPVAHVVASLLAATDEHNGALRQLRLLGRTETIKNLTFRQLYQRVERACRSQENSSNGLRRWRSGLAETNVYTLALHAGAASAVLLPVAWCLAQQRVSLPAKEKGAAAQQILSIGGIYQIGLADVVLPKVQEFISELRTVEDVMVELITRTVHQHLRVAWTRFAPPQGKDVTVIVADMDTWSRNNEFRAGRVGSRLSVSLDWLRQLGLTNGQGLTAAGRRVLGRSLNVLDRSA